MRTLIRTSSLILIFCVALFASKNAFAQTVKTVNVNSLIQTATVSFSPVTGSFTENSTFDVPILVDTQGQSINSVELYIKFDPRKLQIINPTGGQSIIGLWVEPPTYSNTVGTLKLVGAIPGGINTKSGLLAKITFKALLPGSTKITFLPKSQVLANDGLGTSVVANFGTAFYSISAVPSEGPNVFSETNQFQDQWYNNSSPVLAWDKEDGISDYSYIVDDQPFTIPDDTPDTSDNRISLTSITSGVNYFHIKARKNNVWGGTTNFTLKIDSVPPAQFTPTYEKVSTSGLSDRIFVYFDTTDNLSGIDHYEVGVIDKSEPLNVSPVFVQAESPFQIPVKTSGDLRVVVRAFDQAGNVRDASIDIAGFSIAGFVKENSVALLFALLILITSWVLISHFLFMRRVTKALKIAVANRQNETPAPRYLPSAPVAPPTETPVTKIKVESPYQTQDL